MTGSTQSSLAIISSFVRGVKLSISSPRAASAARACGGTSFELSWGAIESSAQINNRPNHLRERNTHHGGKSRKDWEAPSLLQWNGVNPVSGYLDPSVRRRKADTWHQQPIVFESACTQGVQKSNRSHHAKLFGRPYKCQLIPIKYHGYSPHLVERMWLDLRELVLHVIRVHGPNLIPRRSSQDFDDLYQLIDPRLAWKEGLSEH